MSGHCYHTCVRCTGRCFIRTKTLCLLTAVHPLIIPCPLPHCPSAPPDIPRLKIEVSPREAIVTEGQSVTMTCQIISSNPGYRNITWFKDGTPLRKEEVHREQETLTLILSTVTKEMSGNYQCEACNDIGPGKSQVTLQVHCEPLGSWEGGRQGVSRGGVKALER